MAGLVKTLRSSKKLLETTASLLRTRDRLLSAYSAAVQKQQAGRMNYLNRRLQDTNSFLTSLNHIESEFTAEQAKPRFVVSSLFLHECFKQLTSDQKEQFFFITGSEINGALVLDQVCTFEHLSRTEAGVVADPKSTHRVLAKLEQFGHRLLAHFHSHPGHGLLSTGPSGTDTNYQASLEKSGYCTVAAIFSRDGYIRFFRLDQNFELQIHGTGVEHVEASIYRLTDLN
jgi:proteasome lid subunit RPN8/RPN11